MIYDRQMVGQTLEVAPQAWVMVTFNPVSWLVSCFRVGEI
jgi:hypothetical protein